MRKFMIVLPCLLLVHGIAAANEISSRNRPQGETNIVLTAAFESARGAERPSLLPARAGDGLQLAAKKRRKAAATSVRAEDRSSKRFHMTQNGKRMTADDFDAWMKKNGYRVATGAPAASKKVVARNEGK
ncbi:MAG TPA: hypothetical protein VF471_12215 [Pseudoxanthomonas sp.]